MSQNWSYFQAPLEKLKRIYRPNVVHIELTMTTVSQNKLTIVIPTYNRPKNLCAQLSCLFKEQGIHSVNIHVVDNGSKYDLAELVGSLFGGLLPENLFLYQRKFNIGLAAAIIYPFQIVDSGWLWILSDDDILIPNSITRVLKDIELHQKAVWLKYGVNGRGHSNTHEVGSLNELVEIFESPNNFSGYLIFLSNNVFNINGLRPFLGRAFEYQQTWIGHILPALFALNHGSGKGILLSDKIINYSPPVDGTGWVPWVFYGNLALFKDVQFPGLNFNNDYSKRLRYLLIKDVSKLWIIFSIASISNRSHRLHIFNRVVFSLFPFSLIKLLGTLAFYFFYLIRINVLGLVHNHVITRPVVLAFLRQLNARRIKSRT